MKFTASFIALLFIGQMLMAQTTPKPFAIGVTDEITSAQLAEKRVLNIYLPEGYAQDTAAYPVIYLLDGSANEDFIHIAGLVQFLNMIQFLPPSIVVGIANVDRKRDFTYPTNNAQDKKDFPTTGGSAKFMAFIEQELQPYIQKNYRVTAAKTVIGQSLGGLFAAEVLLKKPTMFDTYIIVSPSLWWDDESLLAAVPAYLKNMPNSNLRVYIAVGTEGKIMEHCANALHETLKAVEKPTFSLHFLSLPEENHATILHRSVQRAFEIFHTKK